MILISCRKDFTVSQGFSEKNVIRNYPFAPKLDQFEAMDEVNLAQQMQGKHVLILVHGYRNPLSNVVSSYQRVLKGLIDSKLMRDPAIPGSSGYDLVLGFTWPGFETLVGFIPAVAFANRSAGHFRSLLELASRNALTVDVQTHSLGARVALQSLAGGTEAFVDNLLLTAAAVDNESLEPGKEFNGALLNCRRALVYHSDKDNTLKIGFLIGGRDRALGLRGPENPDVIKAKCPDVVVINCKKVVSSHGGYRTAGAYYEHWSRVLDDTPLAQFETLEG